MGIVDSKALRLLSLLASDPAEFVDRSLMIAGGRFSFLNSRKPEYAAKDWNSIIAQLGEFFGSPGHFHETLREAELVGLTARLHGRMDSLPKTAPFGAFHNGDQVLGELCYVTTRVLRPKTIVETGVCYGVTSAHLLAGLEANGFGHLHSIDLPPLGKNGNDYVGWLVPEELRKRWTLHRGTSRKMLVPLLKKIRTVGLFVHDSLHTYLNMKREFAMIWPCLSPGGVVIADDIEGNTAFQEFSQRRDVAFQAAVREVGKDSLAGILIKQFDSECLPVAVASQSYREK